MLEAGDAAGADFLLQTYLERTPDDADAHNLAGIAKRDLGDAAAARAHFERAVALAPAEATYSVNLAQVLVAAGEGAGALAAVEALLRGNPGQPDALLARAQILERLGRHEEALATARMAVAFNPSHARTRHVLGLVLFKGGDRAAARSAFEEAVALDPAYAEAWINAGVAQKDLGDLDAAEASYRRALALAPRDAVVHNNLANLLTVRGRVDEAIAGLRTALTIDPAYVDAKINLGVALRDAGRLEEAIGFLAQSLGQHPDHAGLLNAYGNTLRQAGRLDQAVDTLQRAIAADPGSAEAHNNLGLALALKQRMPEAADHLRRAAGLKPDSAVISNNYGALLLRMFRFEDAVRALDNALARDPVYDEALVNLGICHYMLGNADAAIDAYRRVLARNPDSSFAHYSLGVAFLEDQRLAEAEAEIARALALDPTNALAQNTLGVLLLDQHKITEARAAMRAAAAVNTQSAPVFYSNYAFSSLYEPGLSNQEILDIHCEYGRRFATDVPDRSRPHRNVRDPGRKLRLAYLSPDFRAHSVAYFFEALLEKHDRTRFDVLLYSDTTRKDKVTAAMQAAADLWTETGGLTNDAFARRLMEDKVDILVNLGGHTSGNRLPVCALKPAPVQIEYLGYPETSGVPAMQYRLSDAQADPVGTAERWCTEELVRLPHCFHCYRPHGRSPEVAPAPHLANGYVTFTSFNVLPKVTDTVIATWAQILAGVPGSRFYLKCKQLRDARVREAVLAAFARAGIDPARVAMESFVPSVADHLNKYAGVDLALDPFPYNGTTTTCEALWMGVPVLTLRGENHRGRVGYSLLHAVGIDRDFVADDVEDYVRRAIAFGRDPAPLAAVRAGLRARMEASPLRDESGFTRTLETTYRRLWQRWCDGPESFMFKAPPDLRPEDSIQGVLVKTL
jgi:predicted O-linked N-acetylglucosamine transferase (SPINDLY family)